MDTETTMNLMGEDARLITEALEPFDSDRALTDDLLEALQGEDNEIPYRLSDAYTVAMEQGLLLRTASDNFKNITDRLDTLVEELQREVITAVLEYREGGLFPLLTSSEGQRQGRVVQGEAECLRFGKWVNPEGTWMGGRCWLKPMVLIPFYGGIGEIDPSRPLPARRDKPGWDQFVEWWNYDPVNYKYQYNNYPALPAWAIKWMENMLGVIESTLSDTRLRDFEVSGFAEPLQSQVEEIYAPYESSSGGGWDDVWTRRGYLDYTTEKTPHFFLQEAWKSAVESSDGVITADESPYFVLVSPEYRHPYMGIEVNM